MPVNVWKYELDLRDIWKNPNLTFEQMRDAVVARIGAARWYDENDQWLSILYQELQEVTDEAEFDAVFGDFYDYADLRRIWVNTF